MASNVTENVITVLNTTLDVLFNATTTAAISSSLSQTPSTTSATTITTSFSTTSLNSSTTAGFSSTVSTLSADLTAEELYCPIHPDKCQTLQTLKEVLYSISFICSVLTLSLVILFRKYFHFSQRIYLHILATHAVDLFIHLVHDGRVEGRGCVAQGFLVQVSGFMLFLWIMSLTVYLFLIIVRDKSRENVERYEWLFVAICWTLPVALATLPIITNDYGGSSVSPYCWIVHKDSGQVWRFIIYWIPVFGGTVAMLAVFIYMYWKTHKATQIYNSDSNDQNQRLSRLMDLKEEYLKPLTWYALSFVILQFFKFINRIQNSVGKTPSFDLMVLHLLCNSLYGIVLCGLFFLLNGRSTFTSERLRSSVDAFKKFGVFKNQDDSVAPYDLPSNDQSLSEAPDTSTISYKTARGSTGSPGEKPTLRISYIDNEERGIYGDDDLPMGDIRTYDITRLDSISLDSIDSNPPQNPTRK